MKAFIDEHRHLHGVEPICKVLPISLSTYYAHAARQADPERRSRRAKTDEALLPQVQRVWDENFELYGARKQTQIGGEGTLDLRKERFDITVAPEPKRASILSLRTPIRVYGSFSDPAFELKKQALLLRIGGAVGLATVAPLAALLPLIETGAGEDTDCAALRGNIESNENQNRQPATDGSAAAMAASRR